MIMPLLITSSNLPISLALPATARYSQLLPNMADEAQEAVQLDPIMAGDPSRLYNESFFGNNESSLELPKALHIMPNTSQSITLVPFEVAGSVLQCHVSAGPFPSNFLSLPQQLHHQIVEDFAYAAEIKDLAYLNRVAEAWFTTAALYGLPETQSALNHADDFQIVHERLTNLMTDDEDEEQIKPTGYAFNKCLSLLIDTKHAWVGEFPRPSITADFNGGIRLLWRRPDRQLRLVIPSFAEGHHYLYHEKGDDYDAQDDPSPGTLAKWFSWLTEE